METERKFTISGWLRSRTGLALLAFLAIAAFYLATEHTAHFFGFLPYTLLLLCPLLHLFMHGGHSGHSEHGDHTETPGSGLAAGGYSGHAGPGRNLGAKPGRRQTVSSEFPAYGLWSLVIINAAVFIILGAAWGVFYKAQREHQLATTGLYAHLRHPQYVGFILIMLGFLLQWPTLLTLVMFPILVMMYFRLARREEREALAEFGEAYARYAATTPAFFLRLSPAPAEQLP